MITVVVPSIREDCIKRFLTEWGEDFRDVNLIVVEDNPEKSFDIPEHVTHVSWAEINEDLGARFMDHPEAFVSAP